MFGSHEQSRNARRPKTTASDSEHDQHLDATNAERDDRSSGATVESSLKKVRIGTFEDSGVCKGYVMRQLLDALELNKRLNSTDGLF